ncbi:MAG: alanine racemase [bacterium]
MNPSKGPRVEDWGLTNRQGVLLIDGVNCLDLAGEFGTPLHVVHEKRLKSNIRRFKEAFAGYEPGVHICYSYKSNGIPGVLKLLHRGGEGEEGLGAEVISPYELWLALRMGVDPGRIIYNGLNKSPESIKLALRFGVRINADSLEELKQIEAVAKELGSGCEIGIRICPRVGWNSQFGLGIEDGQADQAIDFISRSPHLACTGLMCHITTRATGAGGHIRACLDLLRFAAKIRQSHGIVIRSIDLGGGFGVPTVKGLSHWEALRYRLWNRPLRPPQDGECQPIEDMARQILAELVKGCERFGLDPPVLCLEPGRIITSDAQVLLLMVNGIKQRGKKGRVFAITDGGRFTTTYPLDHEYHTAFVANKLNDPVRQEYFVVGRLCSPGDWVFRSIHLPFLQAGDILAIMDAGAYFTQFSTNFSFPRAAVVAVHDGTTSVLRHRETHEYMIGMDVL